MKVAIPWFDADFMLSIRFIFRVKKVFGGELLNLFPPSVIFGVRNMTRKRNRLGEINERSSCKKLEKIELPETFIKKNLF